MILMWWIFDQISCVDHLVNTVLLTKYTLYFVYKNTVFGYHKGLKTNWGQNIVVKHDLGFETCSLTPNLKNVSHPGSFDELYQILEKNEFWWFWRFLLFLVYLYVYVSYAIYAHFNDKWAMWLLNDNNRYGKQSSSSFQSS